MLALPLFSWRERRRSASAPRSNQDLRKEVEDLFLAFDLDAYTNLCDVGDSSAPGAMRAAMAFWQEWSLAAWAEDANMRKGVAPSTGSVLDQYERQRRLLPEIVRPAAKGVAAKGPGRAWAARWRKRWGFNYGSIPTRDAIPVPEMREKARGRCFDALAQSALTWRGRNSQVSNCRGMCAGGRGDG